MSALYHAYTQTVADGTATSVVRPSDWNSAHIQGQTLSGNTAGVSSFTGTNFVLQGGNNVTLSAATAAGAATIIISGANTVAQTVQTQASGAIAGTGFTSTTTAGTAITAAMGTNGLSMAVPQFITTFVNDLTSGRAGTGFTSTTTAGTAVVATQGTNGLSMAVPAFITTFTNDLTSGRAGTGYTSTTQAGSTVGVTLNTNGLSAAWPPFITTATQSVQTQASGAIAGTGFTSTTTAGTAITAALGTNGLSMAVPAFITTFVNDLTSGRAGTGFTSTTTAGTAITAALGTNGLSMAVPAYITTFAAQTTQTQPAGNIAGVGTTLALTNITGTLNVGTNGVALSLSGNAAGGGGGAALQGSGTYTQNTGTIQFANSNGVTFGLSTNQMTASVKTDYAGTGFTSTTTAGTAITAALGTNGLTMAVPAYLTTYVNDLTSGRAGTGTTLATTNISATLSANTNGVALSLSVPDVDFNAWHLLGNTAGTTATTVTTQGALYFHGGNNITLSGNSNTIVISAGAGGGTTNQTGPNIGVSNLGNTAGTTGTVSTGNVVFVGSNGIRLSQSIGAGSTGATISIAEQPLFAWANNLYQVNSQTIQPRQSTSVVFPGLINNAVTFDHIRFPLTVSMGSTTVATTANTTFSLGVFYTINVGFYSTDTGNATSLNSALTTSGGITQQISVQAGTAGSQYTVSNFFTYPANAAGGTSSFSTSYNVSTSNLAISTTNLTRFTGMKHLEIPMLSSLPANMYWIAYGVSSTTSTQGIAGISAGFLVHSNWGMSQPNNTWGFFGQANNASVQAITGVGSFSTAGGGTTAGLGFSNISSSASHVVPYIYMEFDG